MAEVLHHRFRAMGTACHVLVHHDGGATGAGAVAASMVADLEARWSRFRPSSDIGRINLAAGHPVAVSDETLLAVTAAVAARVSTGGAFDPTVLRAVESIGYDRDFAGVAARSLVGAVQVGSPRAARAAVDVDLTASTVTVGVGAALDLGGIGKGLAADLVAGALLAEPGIDGVLVNLGGDLRATGAAPSGAGWGVAIDDPTHPGATLATVALACGGVATSSTRRRRWPTAMGPRHHLVDPGTGTSAATDLASVTVIADAAVDAEVLATAAIVTGGPAAAELLLDAGVAALLVGPDGSACSIGRFDRYRR